VKVLLLHNPTAGGGQTSKESLIRLLSHSDCDVSYLATDDPQLERRVADPVDLLVIAGGDGTVAKVLTHVDSDTAPVTILPMGTANNLANALGIHAPIADLIAGLRNGRTVGLDIGMTEGPWGRQPFFESVGFGALARALGPVNESRVPSRQKIPEGRKALRRVMQDMRPARLQMSLDGRLIEAELLMLELATVGSLGPRLCIASGAKPGDGLLHVAYLPVEQREAMLAWLDHPEDGSAAPTVVQTARRAEVRWQDTPSHLDDYFHDEPAEPADMQAWLQPAAVKVLVPAGADNMSKTA
jgi:diacylglycerol kinase (ATP)